MSFRVSTKSVTKISSPKDGPETPLTISSMSSLAIIIAYTHRSAGLSEIYVSYLIISGCPKISSTTSGILAPNILRIFCTPDLIAVILFCEATVVGRLMS